jgi:hypothetical protein
LDRGAAMSADELAVTREREVRAAARFPMNSFYRSLAIGYPEQFWPDSVHSDRSDLYSAIRALQVPMRNRVAPSALFTFWVAVVRGCSSAVDFGGNSCSVGGL